MAHPSSAIRSDAASPPSSSSQKPRRHLGAFDATMLVMGGIVGGGIFVNLGAWAIGGLIALAGAFVYAELASRLPAAGGHYAYMREAFHPAVAFMFGWATLLVVQTGGIAATAVAFARYFRTLLPLPVSDAVVAVGALALITAINCIGVRAGNAAQRTFMLLKIAAILSIVLCGIVALVQGVNTPGNSMLPTLLPNSGSNSFFAIAAALTPVMFAYGGWQTASFISAELKNPSRDLSRAMIFGVLGVVTLYLSIVAVFLLVGG
jgi:APA family basic amino acid/polyamine antiporter